MRAGEEAKVALRARDDRRGFGVHDSREAEEAAFGLALLDEARRRFVRADGDGDGCEHADAKCQRSSSQGVREAPVEAAACRRRAPGRGNGGVARRPWARAREGTGKMVEQRRARPTRGSVTRPSWRLLDSSRSVG